jgi:hypothetical protein
VKLLVRVEKADVALFVADGDKRVGYGRSLAFFAEDKSGLCLEKEKSRHVLLQLVTLKGIQGPGPSLLAHVWTSSGRL